MVVLSNCSIQSQPPPVLFSSERNLRLTASMSSTTGRKRRNLMKMEKKPTFLSPFSDSSSNQNSCESSSGRAKYSSADSSSISAPPEANEEEDKQNGGGPRKVPDIRTLLRRFWRVAAPYWSSEDKIQSRLRLAAVFALTLGTTGISVGFSFLGRDFYNALASDGCTLRGGRAHYLG